MIRARKRFGQHFLEAAWASKVVRAIDPQAADVFLEIGPGRGAITGALAHAAAHVTAFEIDRDLATLLEPADPARRDRLTVVQGDFLEVTYEQMRERFQRPLRIAGNLPFNVASPILFKLVELFRCGLPMRDATLMLQREVADRLIARPGTREYGVLGILIGRYAKAERRLVLPPGAFRPMPKVHSTLVTLTFHPAEPAARDEAMFEALTQAVFTHRRKTLANALRSFGPAETLAPSAALARAGIDGIRRPETLSIQELVRLSDAFAEPTPSSGS
jgi:16S rRNA (adenine1518-N6/adenine1519-N6)-dimethyltransferase